MFAFNTCVSSGRLTNCIFFQSVTVGLLAMIVWTFVDTVRWAVAVTPQMAFVLKDAVMIITMIRTKHAELVISCIVFKKIYGCENKAP